MVEKAKAQSAEKAERHPAKRRGVKLRPTELAATELALPSLPAELAELARSGARRRAAPCWRATASRWAATPCC
jgi:hypothetical protein